MPLASIGMARTMSRMLSFPRMPWAPCSAAGAAYVVSGYDVMASIGMRSRLVRRNRHTLVPGMSDSAMSTSSTSGICRSSMQRVMVALPLSSVHSTEKSRLSIAASALSVIGSLSVMATVMVLSAPEVLVIPASVGSRRRRRMGIFQKWCACHHMLTSSVVIR